MSLLVQLVPEVLARLDPASRVRTMLEYDGAYARCGRWVVPRPPGPVRVVAVGKAAVPMARAAVQALAPLSCAGVVISPDGASAGDLEAIAAGHPVPDAGSFAAGAAALRTVADASPDDLCLFLISGGGSALMEACVGDLEPADLTAVHDELVRSGADILTMNAVRKHLSAVKGGRLALAASPAEQWTLLVSDVPDGHLDAVASGPTLPDPTTVAEVRSFLRDMAPRLPERVRAELADLAETPGPDHPVFQLARWDSVLDNRHARQTAMAFLQERSITAVQDMTVDDAPVTDALDGLLQRLHALAEAHPGPVAVVSGGELSCAVGENAGLGGRNSHFALCAARAIRGRKISVLSLGTDGIDGASPAAGGIVDGTSWERIQAAGRDPDEDLRRFDSHSGLRSIGADVVTGATGTNVRDLRVLVLEA